MQGVLTGDHGPLSLSSILRRRPQHKRQIPPIAILRPHLDLRLYFLQSLPFQILAQIELFQPQSFILGTQSGIVRPRHIRLQHVPIPAKLGFAGCLPDDEGSFVDVAEGGAWGETVSDVLDCRGLVVPFAFGVGGGWGGLHW